MSTVIKQHFVPRFYLKNFAVNNCTHVFDKHLGKVLNNGKGINVNNVAFEKYFYDLPENLFPEELRDKLELQVIEKTFAKMETDFQKNLRQVIARFRLQALNGLSSQVAISDNEKLNLSVFIAIQTTRTKDFRESSLEADEKIAGELISRFGTQAKQYVEEEIQYIKVGKIGKKKKGKRRKFGLAVDDVLKRQQAQIQHILSLLDIDYIKELASVLDQHIWMIGVNLSPIPLVTSDNPVVKRSWKKEDFLPNNGFASEGVEIVCPITPQLILILLERSFHKQAIYFDRKYFELSVSNVNDYNILQIMNSNRQVYSIKDDFDMAIDVLEKYPEFKFRNRWLIG